MGISRMYMLCRIATKHCANVGSSSYMLFFLYALLPKSRTLRKFVKYLQTERAALFYMSPICILDCMSSLKG